MSPRRFRKVLITGAGGTGGGCLAEHIASRHPTVELHGVFRWHSFSPNPGRPGTRGVMACHFCDMTDFSSVFSLVSKVRPDGIFHLASNANVPMSFANPLAVMQNNVMTTANLLEAVRRAKVEPVVQICSTSEVYGEVGSRDVPISEKCPLRPVNPYAVSKAAQDLLGGSYFRAFGLRIIRTRMFAYINPRRADLFASSFARQIARIEAGLQKELLHGNLDSTRTIIDVRDAVEAYWLALERCKAGEAYNIGGTEPVRVGEILKRLIARSAVPVKTRLDRSRLRPTDVTRQVPDVRKFRRATGWTPTYSLDRSLDALLDHWRREARLEAEEARS